MHGRHPFSTVPAESSPPSCLYHSRSGGEDQVTIWSPAYLATRRAGENRIAADALRSPCSRREDRTGPKQRLPHQESLRSIPHCRGPMGCILRFVAEGLAPLSHPIPPSPLRDPPPQQPPVRSIGRSGRVLKPRDNRIFRWDGGRAENMRGNLWRIPIGGPSLREILSGRGDARGRIAEPGKTKMGRKCRRFFEDGRIDREMRR